MTITEHCHRIHVSQKVLESHIINKIVTNEKTSLFTIQPEVKIFIQPEVKILYSN